MKIEIHPTILQKCPTLQLGILSAEIQVQPSTPELLDLISISCRKINDRLSIDQLKDLPAIQAGRQAYKVLGKDPARYRLSAEALLRRVLNGKGLYHINNIVDLLNLISIETGISIGGYNERKIVGEIQMRAGRADEPYEAIGRGQLNMEFMPLLSDQESAFGSPTSDSTRTMVTADTSQFLMAFFSFAGADGLDSALTVAEDRLQRFANGKTLDRFIYPAQ